MSNNKSLAERMKASVVTTDKFKAAEAAMAAGVLNVPTVEATPPVQTSSRDEKKVVVGDGSVIRENFSMPPSDSMLINELRTRAAAKGVLLNRSEVLRAGLAALSALDDAQLADVANRVPKMKAGRPKSL